MKKELKQKWVEALRSGKYEQGKGVLRTFTDRFCCLGVLCDVLDQSVWGDVQTVETNINGCETEIVARIYGDEDSDGESSSTSLPVNLRERIGLHVADVSTLIAMNDGGDPFEVIAKHIEVNVEAE